MKYKSSITFVSILILCFLVRLNFSDLHRKSQLFSFVGQKISVVGIVVDEPDVREHNVKLTVRVSEVKSLPCTKLCSGTRVSEKILVTVPSYPEFSYGDKLRLDVLLVEPKPIDTDGRVFNYSSYLRVRGIWYTSKFTTTTLLESGHGSIIKNLLFKTKHAFTGAINKALPAPESSLMAGLLIGTKQSLGKDLLAEFQRSGVSHVVVLSGYNIAIVAQSIIGLLSFLPKTFSFSFGVFGIILFTILSGGGASAWRAAIMVLVALFAKQTNREYSAEVGFGIAVFIMLLLNPLLLFFDPSFQLSVLATIGIIFVSPLVSPYLSRVTEKYGLREIVSSTIATQIVVLPYLIYTTGILSLVSLPINVLILGTVPLTMLLGFLVGTVGLISLYLSFIPALFAYVLLWYQLEVVHIGATLPFGAVTLPAFSVWILVLVYVGIGWVLYVLKNK